MGRCTPEQGSHRVRVTCLYLCVVPKIPLGWYFLVVKYGNTTGFELHFMVLPARKHGVNSTRGRR
jgi:hypothetical protein